MKKKGLLSVIFVILILFSTVFVLAQETGVQTNFDKTWNSMASFFTNLFGGINLDPENYSLILLGLLAWMIIYSIINSMNLFGDYKILGSGFVALIITILAFRGFPQGFIEGIVVQYQVLGATIITMIPFIIILWFTVVQSPSLMTSRLIWLIYTIYYFSLYWFKIDSSGVGGLWVEGNAVYIGAIALGIVVLIFLGPIRKIYLKEALVSDVEKAKMRSKKMGAALDITEGIVDDAAG